MKKNKRQWIHSLTIMGFLLILINGCKKDESSSSKNPVITWANPADITYGTLLSATQLNATADAAGTFVYTPAIGTILSVGANQDLRMDFTPKDAAAYNTASKTVKINVTIAVGNSYQGGKVAYILVLGDPGYVAGQTHGIIAASSDQSTGIQWNNGSNTVTGATATALGTGNDNTVTIINSQGAGNYAAKLCYDLVLGGYSDWYLPSKDELNKLYLNRDAIAGFTIYNYWSSSESGLTSASGQYFFNATQQEYFKVSLFYVRAVRSF